MITQAKQSFANSITHRILAMKFAGEFMLIYPIYTIMYTDRGGVDAAGVSVLLAFGLILLVLLELPTGVIADKIARKYVLVASILLKTLGLTIWLFLPFFWGYMLSTVCFALGYALESGALQAYLYGTLGEDSKKKFGKFWARVSAMVMVSYTVAYIFTTIIGVNYPLLIGLSIGASLVALAFCLSLPKDKLIRNSEDQKPKILASALKHITSTPDLVKLLITAVIIVSLAEVMIEYLSLYYNQAGIEARYVALMLAAGNVAGALLFWTLHSWETFLDRYKLYLLLGVTLLFIASFSGGVAIAAIGVLIFTRFLRVLQVQFESNIQHLSNDEARATISSVGSFAAKLVAAAIIICVGIFAVDNSILVPLRIALVTGVVVFIIFQLFDKRRAHQKIKQDAESFEGLQ